MIGSGSKAEDLTRIGDAKRNVLRAQRELGVSRFKEAKSNVLRDQNELWPNYDMCGLKSAMPFFP